MNVRHKETMTPFPEVRVHTLTFDHAKYEVDLTERVTVEHGHILKTVTIRQVDQKFKPATESALLHELKIALNAALSQLSGIGFSPKQPPFIKKLMWKDGHLVDDTQHYLRTAGNPPNDDESTIFYCGILDSSYALHDSSKEFKRLGEYTFNVFAL